MKEKSSFGRVHFREICSVCLALVFLIAFTVVFKLSSPEGLIIQSVESIAILAIFYFVGKNRQVKAILDLRFLVRAFLLGVIIGVLLYCSEINPIIIISAGFIFFTVLDLISKILISSVENKTQRQTLQNASSTPDSSKKNKAETVTASPHDEDENSELSEEEQMNLFKGSNAKQKVKNYTSGRRLCPKAEANLFVYPYNGDILDNYLDKYVLDDENEPKLFDLPDAEHKIRKYIESFPDQYCKGLSNQFFFKLLEQPYALEVFELHCSRHSKDCLNLVQQFRLFEIPEAEKFVRIYIKYHEFNSQYAELKMLDLPHAKEFMPSYCKKAYNISIPDDIFVSSDVLRIYLYNNLDISELNPQIFDLPNAVEFWKEYLHNNGVNDIPEYVTDKMFTSSKASELVGTFIEAGGDLTEEQEGQMFALSNADKLALLYIEKGQTFYDSTEPLIFGLPNAVEVWETYLDKVNLKYTIKETINQMFLSPKAPELVKIYLKEGYSLSEEYERQMFTLPNAEELALLYIENEHEFSNSTEPLIFGLPNAVEVWETYLDKVDIDDIARETVEQMLVSPQASELLEIYFKEEGGLTNEQVRKLLTLPELLSIYIESNDDACKQIENILFDVPDPEKQEKLFEIIINAKKELYYQSSEILMMNLPKGVRLLERYIEYSQLGDVSEMGMFDLDLPDAKRLVLLYEEKRGLCKDAKALAQAKGWL